MDMQLTKRASISTFNKSKKGQLGLNLVSAVMGALLTLSIFAIVVFLVLSALQDANLFTAGSQAANNTDAVINNVTGGTVTFFEQVPTVMLILGVVAIVLTAVIIINVVQRRGGGNGSL